MNAADWLVLVGTMVGIALYGFWRTRHIRSLNTYLRGSQSTGWGTIGLSVMATQASAITFLSTPGQGYEDGLSFVQFYFGLPIAMVILSIACVPRFYKLRVLTASLPPVTVYTTTRSPVSTMIRSRRHPRTVERMMAGA